ncbi:MAG: hypothetical protein CMK74_03880 [Pseudomonadales bacterium]|nr:hypothetical protein [Pseudomonadales bacterium]|tara:strand:- start:141 stop:323 length:183 start_codon:yes stop_codon:yes gene_type:complete
MNTEKVLLETYRKWNDETLLKNVSSFTKPGGIACKPFMQVLSERGLDAKGNPVTEYEATD